LNVTPGGSKETARL